MSLEQLFANVFCISDVDITDELQLQEISTWDSMSHMMLIMRMEETFEVQLTGDQIADIKSVGDARTALQIQGAKL